MAGITPWMCCDFRNRIYLFKMTECSFILIQYPKVMCKRFLISLGFYFIALVHDFRHWSDERCWKGAQEQGIGRSTWTGVQVPPLVFTVWVKETFVAQGWGALCSLCQVETQGSCNSIRRRECLIVWMPSFGTGY